MMQNITDLKTALEKIKITKQSNLNTKMDLLKKIQNESWEPLLTNHLKKV